MEEKLADHELFEIEETFSPYIEFVRKNRIQTQPTNGCINPWCAWIGSDDPVKAVADGNALGFGPTEKEAIFDLATTYQLPGFNTFNWEL
jgi:hypothetical protein